MKFKDLPDVQIERYYEILWFCSPKLNVHDIGGCWMYWVTFLIADGLLVAQSVRADGAAESSQNCPELEILKMLSEICTFSMLKTSPSFFLHCQFWKVYHSCFLLSQLLCFTFPSGYLIKSVWFCWLELKMIGAAGCWSRQGRIFIYFHTTRI